MYKDIVQEVLSASMFTQGIPFTEKNLDQIREAINSTIVATYDSYRGNLETCINALNKEEKFGGYILANNADEITIFDVYGEKSFSTLEEAKQALLDAMIQSPTQDLLIYKTNGSENPHDWTVI